MADEDAGHAAEAPPPSEDVPWTPSKPFRPTPDFASPRRHPSALVHYVSPRRAMVAPPPPPPLGAQLASLSGLEERSRLRLVHAESNARTSLWRNQLREELGLLSSSANTRTPTPVVDTGRVVVDGDGAASSQRTAARVVVDGPLAAPELVLGFDPDTTEGHTVDAATQSPAVMLEMRDEEENPVYVSPLRALAQRGTAAVSSQGVVPATPPSTKPCFHAGGRLRWTEERQQRESWRHCASELRATEEQEAFDRSKLFAESTLASMRLVQQGVALSYEARREEDRRIDRNDRATCGVSFVPLPNDPTLERAADGRPTREAIRGRKLLLRMQRCGRGFLARRRVAGLREEEFRFWLFVRREWGAACRIQRFIRRTTSRVQRAERARAAAVQQELQVYQELRDERALVVQSFAHAWIARQEASFRFHRPPISYLRTVQQWFDDRRAAYLASPTPLHEYVLLPPFVRPRPVGVESDGRDEELSSEGTAAVGTLGRCFGIRVIIVESDACLLTAAFRREWGPFLQRLVDARVAAVGLDGEWVGSNPISLVQICDTERCFLFRSHRISKDKLQGLLNPILWAPHIFKCGVGVRHDQRKLTEFGLGPVSSLLDLVTGAAATDYLPERGRGLEPLFEHITGLTLGKDKGITVSNWEEPSLSAKQMAYASDDAIAGLAIFAAIVVRARHMHLLPPLTAHGRCAVADDDAARRWLAVLAATKPPQMQQTSASAHASPAGATAAVASPKKTAKLPCPSDIRVLGEGRPIFDNIRVLSIEGVHIFTCDLKKANWYTRRRKLAKVTGRDPSTGKITEIQLKFEPAAKTKICMNWQLGSCAFGDRCLFAHGVHELVPAKPTRPQAVGRGGQQTRMRPRGTLRQKGPAEVAQRSASASSSESAISSTTSSSAASSASSSCSAADLSQQASPAGTTAALVAETADPVALHVARLGRANACSVCLVTGSRYSKHPVVPGQFRRHFPADLRKARTFDYVLVCSQCLPRVQAVYNGERRRLWEASLAAPPQRTPSAPSTTKKRLTYTAGARLFRYCEMLASPDRLRGIPAARQAEMEELVLSLYPSTAPPLAATEPADVSFEPPDRDDGVPPVEDGGSRSAQAAAVVKVVLQFDMQDWAHSVEAEDVANHWKAMAATQGANSVSPPRTSSRCESDEQRQQQQREQACANDALLDMAWAVRFIRHWRTVFQENLRPILVPWSSSSLAANDRVVQSS